MAHIQWYPGHMAKAKREAIENRKMVDIIIELVDARIPESSRNPIVDEISGNKPRLILLNKADLADPKETQKWLAYYNSKKGNELRAAAISSHDQRDISRVKAILKEMAAAKMQALAEKGVKGRPIRLMVLGIPNVGKSSFINQMIGKKKAQTGDRPGVTKAQKWLKIGAEFELLDTPGILWPKFEDQEVGQKLAMTGAIKDTLFHKDDVVLDTIRFFMEKYPGRFEERYGVEEESGKEALPQYLMDITAKLGMGEDYERACERILHDLRNKRLGTFTLDSSPANPVSTRYEEDSES